MAVPLPPLNLSGGAAGGGKASAGDGSSTKGVMDGSNWTVNYGQLAQTSPATLMLYAALALGGFLLWKRLK